MNNKKHKGLIEESAKILFDCSLPQKIYSKN